MKQFFVLLLACCCAHHALAQKFRMVDTTNRWVVHEDWGADDVQHKEFELRLGSDTLIAGHHYLRMLSTSLGRPWEESPYVGTYYREDSLNNRVYCINTFIGDTVERLIFDLNWRTGDTAYWFAPSGGGTLPRAGFSIVQRVDSTLILGNWYRTFLMGGPLSMFYIVEGVGCLKSPGFATFAVTFENDTRITCFHHEGSRPTLNPSVGYFDNTGSCYLSVIESPNPTEIFVCPNPADKNALLHVPSGFSQCKIVDAIGRQLATIDVSGKTRVPIGPYLQAPGIYLLVLTNASGQRVVRKFVFEN